MHFERVADVGHPCYREAIALYRESFPPHEQREAPSQERVLHDNAYHFSLLYDGALFAGLALYWEMGDALYIEHLCIQPALRGRQYGQKALSLLAEKQGRLILEIDPPVDEISKRRKGFYERCGFVENPFPHIHPPYHKGNEGHSLVVMSHPRQLSQSEYQAFCQCLREGVMQDAFA